VQFFPPFYCYTLDTSSCSPYPIDGRATCDPSVHVHAYQTSIYIRVIFCRGTVDRLYSPRSIALATVSSGNRYDSLRGGGEEDTGEDGDVNGRIIWGGDADRNDIVMNIVHTTNGYCSQVSSLRTKQRM
jgi:hypothetical protein